MSWSSMPFHDAKSIKRTLVYLFMHLVQFVLVQVPETDDCTKQYKAFQFKQPRGLFPKVMQN